MITKILKPTEKNIELASSSIKNNEVVCFKTDTIYGLAANPFSDDAIKKIFKAKQRPENKPILLLASKTYPLENLVEITPKTKEIINTYWPGSLTIIFPLKQNHCLSKFVTAGANTIAIRIPDDKLCNKLCNLGGGLITSTSANISGKQTKNSAQEILTEFEDGCLSYILDGGKPKSKLPSTLIKIQDEKVVVLRQGNLIVK